MEKISCLNWQEFQADALFQIERPNARIQTDYESGDIPFIASGSENNGVQKYCSIRNNESLDKGNCITVSPVDGYAFYQEKDFLGRGGAGSSIIILRNKCLNKYNALFICSVIREICSKWSYNDMGSVKSIASEKIKLPVDSSGNPDFAFMESYIKKMLAKQQKELKVMFAVA